MFWAAADPYETHTVEDQAIWRMPRPWPKLYLANCVSALEGEYFHHIEDHRLVLCYDWLLIEMTSISTVIITEST